MGATGFMVPAMEGKKGAYHPLKNWKEIRYDHKIIIKIFWFSISAHLRLHPRVNVIFVS
jgi:hypothetical protein